nr:DUF433 domain-containing protein [Frankia gtarii]
MLKSERRRRVHFTRIAVNPAQMGGVPCIRGLRSPVATVVGMIADGMSVEVRARRGGRSPPTRSPSRRWPPRRAWLAPTRSLRGSQPSASGDAASLTAGPCRTSAVRRSRTRCQPVAPPSRLRPSGGVVPAGAGSVYRCGGSFPPSRPCPMACTVTSPSAPRGRRERGSSFLDGAAAGQGRPDRIRCAERPPPLRSDRPPWEGSDVPPPREIAGAPAAGGRHCGV